MTDTLRSICEQCTHLSNPQLDFIPDELSRQKGIIVRDLKELVSAASGEHEKTVTILAGSILESVLFSFIAGQARYIADRRGEFTFDPMLGLEEYKNIFNRWFGDRLPSFRVPDFIIAYRNLVHINRELNSAPDICSKASRSLLLTLNSLLGELSRFAGPSFPG
jgi:hypothetical protein